MAPVSGAVSLGFLAAKVRCALVPPNPKEERPAGTGTESILTCSHDHMLFPLRNSAPKVKISH